ncbi:MAG TPA: hypothetical protein V6C76_11160 [Drouetiella sp.]
MSISTEKPVSAKVINVRERWSKEPEIPENFALALIAASLLLATAVFFSVYKLVSFILNDYVVGFACALILSSVMLRVFPDLVIKQWKDK